MDPITCAIAFTLTLWPVDLDPDAEHEIRMYEINEIVASPLCITPEIKVGDDGASIHIRRQNRTYYQQVTFPMPTGNHGEPLLGEFRYYYEFGQPAGNIDGFPEDVTVWESPHLKG